TGLGLKVALGLRASPSLRRWRPVLKELGRFWPTAVVLGIVLVGYIAYKAAHGASLSSGLGDYSAVATTHYSFHDGARWFLYHLAELPLVSGVVPACAFVVQLQRPRAAPRSEEHTSELQSRVDLVCRLLLE